MPDTMVTFAREDIAPSWWANALNRFLSTASLNFRLELLNNTTVRVPAAASDDLAAISVDGKWRYVEANVDRAHPGGAAGSYPLFVTTRANDIRTVPAVGSDFTNYSFDLAFAAIGGTPAIVPGTVDHFRKVADVQWDGAKITRITPTFNPVGPLIRAALAGTSGDPSDTNRYVTNADARNADSRVPKGAAGGSLSGTYPNPTVALVNGRAVGLIVFTDDGRIPTQAENDALAGTAGVVGNANRYVTDADARNTNQRVPTDGSVTNAKVAAGAAIAESKLVLASDAAVGTPSRRTLGPGALQAAPGNDARFPTAAEKAGLVGTAGVVGAANPYATKTTTDLLLPIADPRVPSQAENDALQGTSGAPGNANRYLTNGDARVTADQAAATAAIRRIGVGALDAAAGNHTHAALAVLAANTPSVRQLGSGPTDAAPGDHLHDGRYYTETEVDDLLADHAGLGETAHPIGRRLPSDGFPTAGLINGQIVIFDMGPAGITGGAWAFQYDAGGPRWRFIGGPDLVVVESATQTGSPGAVGPAISFPLAGDYIVRAGGKTWHSEVQVATERLQFRRGDGTVVGPEMARTSGGADWFGTVMEVVSNPITVAKNAAMNLKQTCDTAQGRTSDRWISATPVFCTA